MYVFAQLRLYRARTVMNRDADTLHPHCAGMRTGLGGSGSIKFWGSWVESTNTQDKWGLLAGREERKKDIEAMHHLLRSRTPHLSRNPQLFLRPYI